MDTKEMLTTADAKSRSTVASFVNVEDVERQSNVVEHKSTATITQCVVESSKPERPSEPPQKNPEKIAKILNLVYDIALGYSSVYKILFAIVLSANIIAMATTLRKTAAVQSPPLLPCANAAVANLTAAIMVRQPYVLNLMYHTIWNIPRSTPLWIRHQLARAYEFGGVHTGAACSSFVWFCLFTGYLIKNAADQEQSLRGTQWAVLVLVFILLLALLFIIVTATPQMRRRHHNLFEQNHRLLGWLTVGIFWVTLVLFTQDYASNSSTSTDVIETSSSASTGAKLVRLPIFWLLIYLSISAIWPWLLLRKVKVVRVEHLSDHAVRLYFDPKERIPPQHGATISKSPLREWHAFAAINDFDNTEGGSSSLIISRAGDWTADTIRSPAPYYYMRGIHQTGAGSTAKCFNRIVFMCTGSGAGPLLAALTLLDDVKLRIIWSAPHPEEIFGTKICNALRRWDEKAIIWDTRRDGRPDLINLAERVYREHDAEALFFISNRVLTKKVVLEMRRRNCAAFSPVFDS